MRFTLIFALTLMLAGCATRYGKSGIFGGYWDHQGPGELIEVGFGGNGYTDNERVEIYLLYRSAEIAKKRGKNHFTIYQTLNDAILELPLTETKATLLGGKPNGKVFMLLHDSAVPGALTADDVIARYAAQVKGQSTPVPVAGGMKP